MNNEKKARFTGVGIGYVSIIIIFAVIVLTALAVLSFQAAGAGVGLTEKSAEYTAEYYSADSEAKRILAELDAAATEGGDFLLDALTEAAEPDREIRVSQVSEGVRADYSVKINERQSLNVSVTFFEVPLNGGRWRIDRWQSGTDDAGSGEGHLGVWDGTFPEFE